MRYLILALAAASVTAARAPAQNCCGGVGSGPRCSNSAAGGCIAGPLGIKQYPLSDARYIRQFCGPHVAQGSCFGYFKPQITPWGEACPYYGDARVDAANSGLHKYNSPPAAGTTATLPLPRPEATPGTPKAAVPVPEVRDVPTPMTPPVPDAGIPPKPPSAPIVPPTVPKL